MSKLAVNFAAPHSFELLGQHPVPVLHVPQC
jgi:hypothetical protein